MAITLPQSQEMVLQNPAEDSFPQRQITWRIYFENLNGQLALCTLDLDDSWTGEDVMRKLCAKFKDITTVSERIFAKAILMRKLSVAVVKIRSVGSHRSTNDEIGANDGRAHYCPAILNVKMILWRSSSLVASVMNA